MGAPGVVTVIDYRASKGISDIGLLLEKADKKRMVTPKDWKTAGNRFRSLTVYEDGRCMLHSLSTALMIRRLTKGTMTEEAGL